jgi:hypothetical protein
MTDQREFVAVIGASVNRHGVAVGKDVVDEMRALSDELQTEIERRVDFEIALLCTRHEFCHVLRDWWATPLHNW